MKRRIQFILSLTVILGLLSILVACHGSGSQTSQSDENQNESGQGESATAKKHKRSETTRSREPGSEEPGQSERERKPAEPAVATMTVPQGTALAVRLADSISTKTASEGSSFNGTLASALVVNGVEIAPVGSNVSGRVTHVVSSGRLNRPAELGLTLVSITPASGGPVEISTSTWSKKGESHKKRNEVALGGGAAVGAVIGALAGKGKGAAIGALAGGGAGAAGAALTGKKEIVLAPESQVSFTLTTPFTVQMRRPGR